MNLDDLLHATLHDEHWALPVPLHTLDGVRRGRAARRRRTAVLVVATCGAVLAGGALSFAALPGSKAQLNQVASSGVPASSPAPGISPAFVPTSGRDWLLTSTQFATYNASHSHPSRPRVRARSPPPRRCRRSPRNCSSTCRPPASTERPFAGRTPTVASPGSPTST